MFYELSYSKFVFQFRVKCLKQGKKISDFCLKHGQGMRGRAAPLHPRIYRVLPGGKVHRRSNMNNLNDTRTNDNWWGLKTFISKDTSVLLQTDLQTILYRQATSTHKKQSSHIIIDTVTVREKVILRYPDRQIIYQLLSPTRVCKHPTDL